MKIIPLFFLFAIFFQNAYATKLEDFSAHSPTSDVWSEQWFYNLGDPNTGYIKVSLQTYKSTEMDAVSAYIHVAYSPINGPTRVNNYYFDNVELDHPTNPGKFYYHVENKVTATEEGLELNLPDFKYSVSWLGPHQHYWSGFNPGKSPMGILADIPSLNAQWFIYSVGTPAAYSFSNDEVDLSGIGTMHIDKGWFDQAYTSNFLYVLGLTDQTQLFVTGGPTGSLGIEPWFAKYVSDDLNLTFPLTIKGLGVKSNYDGCQGELNFEIRNLTYKLVVSATAEPDTFYLSEMPSVKLFNSEQGIMKSMQARIDIKVYHFGRLIEEKTLDQGHLEFSGETICAY